MGHYWWQLLCDRGCCYAATDKQTNKKRTVPLHKAPCSGGLKHAHTYTQVFISFFDDVRGSTSYPGKVTM